MEKATLIGFLKSLPKTMNADARVMALATEYGLDLMTAENLIDAWLLGDEWLTEEIELYHAS